MLRCWILSPFFKLPLLLLTLMFFNFMVILVDMAMTAAVMPDYLQHHYLLLLHNNSLTNLQIYTLKTDFYGTGCYVFFFRSNKFWSKKHFAIICYPNDTIWKGWFRASVNAGEFSYFQIKCKLSLRLPITQKSLQLHLLVFLSFSFCLMFLEWLGKVFYVCFRGCYRGHAWPVRD